MSTFNGHLVIQQRVLPDYRIPFFDTLAARCTGGLTVFAGDPLPGESIAHGAGLQAAARIQAVNDHRFHPGHPLFRCKQPELLAWLHNAHPDGLILEANPRYPDNLKAADWMRYEGLPVLGWGLGAPALKGPGQRIRERARRLLLSRLDGIIAYSSQGAGEYIALGILPDAAVFTAFNAVSPPPVKPSAAPGQRVHPLNVLFVGRLQRRKRLDLLFDACTQLPSALQPCITVVGDGPDRVFFEDFAAQHYSMETTFTGALHGDALAARFRNADLFVLPGTGGLAIQEAMGHGLPVIAAEGDGTQRDLVRPENGWLINPGDQSSLKKALQEALSDREGLAVRGAAGRRITTEEINIERMADRFIEALTTVSNNA
jgi:glycosyltransferase involved in cell wall biosynthesis